MRFKQSFGRLFEAVKARPLSVASRSLVSDPRATTVTACVEPLERRTLLSVTKVPVLVYHTSDVVDNPTDTEARTYFKDQMTDLWAWGFDSITVEEFHRWRQDGTIPAEYSADPAEFHPFIAIFDDATPDALVAAQWMNQYGFDGVIAIPTDSVRDNSNDSTYMWWSQIQSLVNGGWGVASHTVEHDYLGNGPGAESNPGAALPRSQFTNTPAAIHAELLNSREQIKAHVKKPDGITPYTPLGFVHPHDDVTLRTLSIAPTYYPVVFGGAYGMNLHRFAASNSGLTNGQMLRIFPTTSTGAESIPTFKSMLNAALVVDDTYQTHMPNYTRVYKATNGTVVMDGTDGNDTLAYAGDPDTPRYSGTPAIVPTSIDIDGHGGNDVITTGNLPSTLTGGAGADSIIGGTAADVINGGTENDTVRAGGGNDTISGAGNTDQLHGEDGNDSIMGDNGTDQLHGGAGNDTIHGGNDNDILTGGDGADSMFGSGGMDTVDYTAKSSFVRVTVGNAGSGDGTLINNVSEGDNVQNDVEQVWGSGFNDVLDARAVSYAVTLDAAKGSDTIFGGGGSDVLIGGVGTQTDVDSIRGGAGNDTLFGGGGDDWLWGETGVDWFDGGPGTMDRADWVTGETKTNVEIIL